MTRTTTRTVTRKVRTRLLAPRLRRPPTSDTPEGESVLRVCGELDFLTADQLRRRIEAETARHRHIVLDLTVATFYDRAALETLDEIRARARRAGCTLTINARRRTETPGHPDIIATADSPDSPGPPGPLASSSRRLLRGR